MNEWIDEQIQVISKSLEDRQLDGDEIKPKNFIEAYLLEMRTNDEFDSEVEIYKEKQSNMLDFLP